MNNKLIMFVSWYGEWISEPEFFFTSDKDEVNKKINENIKNHKLFKMYELETTQEPKLLISAGYY